MNEESLKSIGSRVAIKAVNEGTVRVGGYGVLFATRDLVGDVFTSGTDFGLERGPEGMPVFYEHGQHPMVKARIGRVVAVDQDETGLFFEMELERHQKYINDILKLVEAGKVGLSTGALSHLVERDGQKNITRWLAGEVSLTVTPAEPGTVGVQAMKGTEMNEEMTAPVAETGNEEAMKALQAQVAALTALIEAEPATKSAGAFVVGDVRTDEYTKSFDSYLRGGGMPAGMKALSTGSGSAGAFVPESYSTEYHRKLTLGSVLRQAGVKVITNPDGQPYNHPVVTTSSVSATPGDGIIAENAQFTEREPAITNVQFNPFIYTARTQVSMMLVDDSRFDIMGLISDNHAAVFAGQENRDLFIGTGSGMPQGIAVGGSAVEAAGATFAASDIKKLYYAMPQQYRIAGRCAWFANDSIIKEIDSFVGAGGGQYIWQPSLAEGQPGMLMGFPIYGAPFLDSTTDASDKILAFVNLDCYAITDFISISIMRLNERYADSGAVGFIAYKRTDGKVLDSNGVKYLQMPA